MKYLFLHIPKTGGTSFGFVFDYLLNRKVYWDYNETYAPIPSGVADALAVLLSTNQLLAVGGHITYKQYEQLAQAAGAKVIATIRDPLSHFISKINHDLNIAISSRAEARQIIRSIAERSPRDEKGSIILSPDEINNIYSIDPVFDQFSMKDYLRAYLSGSNGSLNYDYLVPVSDQPTALQYFCWKENLSRLDPAHVTSKSASFPHFNSSTLRDYRLAISDSLLDRMRDHLASAFITYEELMNSYARDLCDAEHQGFSPKKLPTSRLTIDK